MNSMESSASVRVNNLNGFTLIELLFAFLIMSIMLSLIYNAIFTVIKGVKIVDRIFETPSKALIISKIFERELTGIYLPESIPLAIPKDDKGKFSKSFIKEQMVFGLKGRNREIHFTSLIPLGDGDAAKLGDVIELGYIFDKNSKILTRRKDPIPDDRIDKGGENQDLSGCRRSGEADALGRTAQQQPFFCWGASCLPRLRLCALLCASLTLR